MSHASSSSQSRPRGIFQRFVHSQVSGSIVLMACTVLALVWANSPWSESYFELAHSYIGVGWGDSVFKLSLQHWINDFLMVIFFFVVGLEIKREMVVGELSTMKKAILPVSAAVGGMVVPALVYVAFNLGGEGIHGWGVPMATDIAFALGILALFGSRVPIGLKVFLTALAIADDMGAVLVIAFFYTDEVRLIPLLVAAGGLILMGVGNRMRIRRVGFWAFLVLLIWVGVFASGIHATIAGILMAMMVPVRAQIDPRRFLSIADKRIDELRAANVTRESMVSDVAQQEAIHELQQAATDMRPPGLFFERYLHPAQAFIILPLFAFFNAGVRLSADSLSWPLDPITLGIILGLVLGKQVGVSFASWVAVRFGGAELPSGVTWTQIWGASCLAGVGFTMSLFITELAFKDPAMVAESKVGILAASLIAGIMGWLVLRGSLKKG